MRIAVSLTLLAFFAQSYPDFQQKIPNGEIVMKNGFAWPGVGHLTPKGGDNRNPFGVAFQAAGNTWTKALCEADSDGDGISNGEELGDPDCTWTEGAYKKHIYPKGPPTGHPGFHEDKRVVPAIGSSVTITGYVVDTYCWDKPSRIAPPDSAYLTLKPSVHSVYCMTDITVCRNSGFTLLEKLPFGNSAGAGSPSLPVGYWAKYKLDPATAASALQVMKTTSTKTDFKITVTGYHGGVHEDHHILVAGAVSEEGSNMVAVSGFLVDNYCWNKPNHLAIDGAKLGTAPQDHTVHCLRDVQECIDSGYAILEKPAGASEYQVKYKLDAVGNANALKVIKATKSVKDFFVTAYGVPADGVLTDATIVEDLQYHTTPISIVEDEKPASEPAGGASSLSKYGLETEVEIAPDVSVHYKRTDDDMKIAVSVPGTGWAGLAIGKEMADGDAVIGGGLKGGGAASDIKAYKLTAQGEAGVNENEGLVDKLTELLVLHEDGKTHVIFKRPMDNGMTKIVWDADTPLLFAYGEGTEIKYHGANKKAVALNFATGASAEDTTVQDNKLTHAICMILGWGTLIPMGTSMAAWGGPRFKAGGGKFFKAHRAIQSVGLLVALAGVIFALTQLYGEELPTHGLLGLIIMSLGVLQPMNAFIRPHNDQPYRKQWELIHKNIGRTATLLGPINCVLGAALAFEQHPDVSVFDTLRIISIVLVVTFVCAWVSGKVWSYLKIKKIEGLAEKSLKDDSGSPDAQIVGTPKDQ